MSCFYTDSGGTWRQTGRFLEVLGQAVHHLGVGVLHAAQVPAEAVLVQLFMGLGVPEAAGVGADLVRQDNGPVLQAAELQLEVHQGHAAGGPEGLEEVVDLEGVLLNGLNFLLGGQLQGQGVVLVQKRVPQVVVFVGELDGRAVLPPIPSGTTALPSGTSAPPSFSVPSFTISAITFAPGVRF